MGPIQLPPQDLEAEQACIGSMMHHPSAVAEVSSVVSAADFYVPAHQRLFEMLVAMEQRGEPIDLVTARNEVQRRGIEDFGTTPEQIAEALYTQFFSAVPSHLNARWYAEIVQEKSRRRRLIALCQVAQANAHEPGEDIATVLEQTIGGLLEITQATSAGQCKVESLLEDVFASLQSSSHLTGVPTGFVQLDDMLSGLQNGELIVVGARPSMGKTAFGLNLALHAAMAKSVPTIFFSLEMGQHAIVQRLLCMHGRVNSHALRRGFLSQADIDKLRETAKDLSGPLWIDDSPSPSVHQIRAAVRMRSLRGGCGLVIIDYLQLIRGNPRSENRQVQVAEISRDLKAMARDLKIPVVVLAQLNRQVESRGDNRPRMSDLRESGAVEQDADVVMLLHREEYYQRGKEDLKGKAQVIVAKQRNGPTGEVELRWHDAWMRFDNASTEPDAHAAYQAYAASSRSEPEPEMEPYLVEPQADASSSHAPF